MSFWKKDQGEKRSFAYEDEFSVGPDGRLHRTGAIERSAELRATLASIYRAIANELEAEAVDTRRQATVVVEGHVLHSMVSGR